MMAAGSAADTGVRARPRELGHRHLDRDRVHVLAGERVEVVDVGWRDGEQVEHVQIHEERVVALAGKHPGAVGQLPDGLCGQRVVVGRRTDADVDRRRRQIARRAPSDARAPAAAGLRSASRHRTV